MNVYIHPNDPIYPPHWFRWLKCHTDLMEVCELLAVSRLVSGPNAFAISLRESLDGNSVPSWQIWDQSGGLNIDLVIGTKQISKVLSSDRFRTV